MVVVGMVLLFIDMTWQSIKSSEGERSLQQPDDHHR